MDVKHLKLNIDTTSVDAAIEKLKELKQLQQETGTEVTAELVDGESSEQ